MCSSDPFSVNPPILYRLFGALSLSLSLSLSPLNKSTETQKPKVFFYSLSSGLLKIIVFWKRNPSFIFYSFFLFSSSEELCVIPILPVISMESSQMTFTSSKKREEGEANASRR
jgi:FtsH-binding integral membrane protein